MNIHRGRKIEVIGEDSSVMFESITDLARHVSMSIPRVTNYLNGRVTLSDAEFEELVKMSYRVPQIGLKLK